MTDKRSTLDTDREEPKIESTFEEMLIKGGHTSMKEEVLIIDPSLDTSMTEKHETSSVTGTIDRDMKNRNSELQGTLYMHTEYNVSTGCKYFVHNMKFNTLC